MFNLIKQSISMAFKSLLVNKTRSFLTMLGIIIGVAAVIIIMALGAGAQSLVLDQVKSLGTNLIGVIPGGSDDNGPPASAMGIVITTLTYEDALAIKKDIPYIDGVVAYSKGVGGVSWGGSSYNTNLSGSTFDYPEVEGGEILEGRFFTKEEETNLSRVVVLGYAVKKELFGDSDAVGQRIKIKKHTFDVIGVMKERGTVALQDYDDQVFIPIKTMQKLILGVDYLGLIRIKVNNEENIDLVKEEVELLLRDRHDIDDPSGENDDFSVRSAAQALDMISSITDALKYFLAAMAALSLIVGGIGIMNIMLVSITERTKEIGLRKAVGANNLNITFQFLIEAMVITFLGGVLGILTGIFFSYLITIIIRYLGYSWSFGISVFSILISILVASAVGLVFGLYPARRAASLEPVEALRYE